MHASGGGGSGGDFCNGKDAGAGSGGGSGGAIYLEAIDIDIGTGAIVAANGGGGGSGGGGPGLPASTEPTRSAPRPPPSAHSLWEVAQPVVTADGETRPHEAAAMAAAREPPVGEAARSVASRSVPRS